MSDHWRLSHTQETCRTSSHRRGRDPDARHRVCEVVARARRVIDKGAGLLVRPVLSTTFDSRTLEAPARNNRERRFGVARYRNSRLFGLAHRAILKWGRVDGD